MTQPVDYWGIRQAISLAIRNSPELAALPVHLERTDTPSLEQLPCVLVFMTDRQSIEQRQRIGAGLLLDHRLTFAVWVLAGSLVSLADAVERRDRILAQVELALMGDRSLGGAVSGTELSGGEVIWNGDPNLASFTTAIETLVLCDVQARR